MLLTEWNQDEAIEVAREEGREEILKLFERGLSIEEIKEKLQRY
jgi:hypothetical protein